MQVDLRLATSRACLLNASFLIRHSCHWSVPSLKEFLVIYLSIENKTDHIHVICSVEHMDVVQHTCFVMASGLVIAPSTWNRSPACKSWILSDKAGVQIWSRAHKHIIWQCTQSSKSIMLNDEFFGKQSQDSVQADLLNFHTDLCVQDCNVCQQITCHIAGIQQAYQIHIACQAYKVSSHVPISQSWHTSTVRPDVPAYWSTLLDSRRLDNASEQDAYLLPFSKQYLLLDANSKALYLVGLVGCIFVGGIFACANGSGM